MTSTTPYITRLAPSPTGMMHIGTARTGLFAWLAARATGGRFILRLDDTDADRNIAAAEQPILDGLRWLGLDWDDYVRQSDRMHIYASMARLMLMQGLATEADNGAILLKLQGDMPRAWHDEVAGEIAITDRDLELMDGLPLLRGQDKGGQATYQFASVLDDYQMRVNYIIRGTDHIPNTAKQVAIWHSLDKVIPNGLAPQALPKFAHVGLIMKDKKKLSKRDGAASLLDYRDRGFDPDAIFNFLLRLGWGPRVDNKENSVLTRDRALEMFLGEGRMRSSNANFDEVKLAWFDKVHKNLKRKAAPEAGAAPKA